MKKIIILKNHKASGEDRIIGELLKTMGLVKYIHRLISLIWQKEEILKRHSIDDEKYIVTQKPIQKMYRSRGTYGDKYRKKQEYPAVQRKIPPHDQNIWLEVECHTFKRVQQFKYLGAMLTEHNKISN